jgi:hypothetical protein
MKINANEIHQEFEKYEIRIKGHIEDRWTDWFDGMEIRREKDGTTTLSGYLPDQTALHSVLQKMRNMNLLLISFEQIQETEDRKQEIQSRKEKENDCRKYV